MREPYYPPASRTFEPIKHHPPTDQRGVPDCLEPGCTRPIVSHGMCSRHKTLEEV